MFSLTMPGKGRHSQGCGENFDLSKKKKKTEFCFNIHKHVKIDLEPVVLLLSDVPQFKCILHDVGVNPNSVAEGSLFASVWKWTH